jgi:endonuclease/exonuclease/phosphatase family metal-dependent hydrolase
VRKSLFAAAWLALVGPLAHASILLSNSFDYPDGALVSVSGGDWVHHSGATGSTGEVKVAGNRVFLSQTNSEDVSAQLLGQPYPATTNILLYAGFTINVAGLPSGNGGYFAHVKNGSSGFAGRIFLTTNGASAGTFRVGIANSDTAPSAVINSNLFPNMDYSLLIRYAPSNGVGTLWLNPTSESDPSVTAPDPPSTVTVTSFALRESLSGGDGMGSLFFDNLLVGTTFADVYIPATPTPPQIIIQPADQTVTAGSNAMFAVAASGTPPLAYQWQFAGTNLVGETNANLILSGVTTNQAGPYAVTITNSLGTTNSRTASLTVNPAISAGISILTYNVNGNGKTDWATNASQVQAIGHQLLYLQPDIVTFNEIPRTNTWQMTNWVTAFLPGYNLATNSGTDGFIRSVIASRFPITRSQSWLDGASLTNFGFNGHVARDLFEAQIAVPGFPQPLHVFTAHLKATIFPYQDDADQRAAEASAISNFFVTTFLATNSNHPYVLTGDLNEDIFRPDTNNYVSGEPVQRLIGPPTGLVLTTPLNPATQADFTESIRGPLNVRFDYILPCGLLFSNISSSQVFRTDLLTNTPPPLLANDDKTASDHLPVLMVFSNPYNKPFDLTSISRTNQNVTLEWQSVLGQPYRVEASSNLTAWAVFSSNITATGSTSSFSTNVPDALKFFRVYRFP